MTDREARTAIITELKKNIFVIAGAGSGKTSMLVNRMVSLVEKGEATIDQICAITFTVNAATEFLQRLRKTLKRRSKGIPDKEDTRDGGLGPITEEIKQRDKIALENIDLCFAGTIDSFCNLALSEYPLDANIPSSSSVLQDEDEIKALYKKEYARLSKEYQNDDLFKAFVSLFKNPSQVFADSINDVIEASFLDIQFPSTVLSVDDFVKDFKSKYEKQLKTDLKAIKNAEDNLVKTNMQGNPSEGIELFDNFKGIVNKYLTDWTIEEILDLTKLKSSLCDSALQFDKDPCSTSSIIQYKYGSKTHNYAYDKTAGSFGTMINEIEEAKWLYSVKFLAMCADNVRKELKKQGKLTFAEYLYTFKELVKNDALNNDMMLIKHIRNKFHHFLIDESQDTSPLQYQLFLYLCKEDDHQDKDLRLVPGSLFIVGDPKQSIYRFRNADIDAYNDVKNIFSNPKHPENMVVELTNNYRSSKMLCSYFNNQFHNMDYYTDIANVASKKVDGEGLYTFSGSELVDVIKTIVNNNKYQILKKTIVLNEAGQEEEVEELSNLDYQDIMVVCWKKKGQLSSIARQLDKEGIPYYTEGDNLISTYEIGESIYAIYAYVAYKNKQHYFYNLLTSPLFGLKKEDALCINPLQPTLPKDLENLLGEIDQLSNIENPAILLKTIIDVVVFKRITSQRMDYAYFLLNKLEGAFANSEVTTLDDGAIFIYDLISEPLDRIAQMKHGPNAVYVSNVHKVKGLEKPVVILCKGALKSPKPRIQKHMDYNAGKSYIFRLAEIKGFFNVYSITNTSTYAEELELECDKLIKEYERLKYVAVTRARNYLFIQKDEGDKSESGNCWINLINGDFKSFSVNASLTSSKKTTNRSSGSFDACRKFANSQPETYKVVLPSKLKLNNEGHHEEETIKSEADNSAAEKGTLIHALLEIYVSSDMRYSKDDAIYETLNRFGLQDNEQYKELLSNVFDTMTSGGYVQASGNKEDLFEVLKAAEEIYCEMPFAYQDGSNIFNGSIDLFYKYKGEYYIVDYKTNYDGNNLDEKYALQLDAYKQAVKNIAGITASARIYHIDTKD